VEHHTSFFANLISEGILKPSKGRQQTVTYHDSCYLSRWNEITKAPRDILRSLPGAHCLEMKDHDAKSLCCGAGGGHFWLKEKTGKRINHLRADQAITTRASTVATSCPFCMTMLEDALKAQGVADKVRVADLAELLDEATS
jgi:Fe-S oxidoreductase